jgi:hypothetical protein
LSAVLEERYSDIKSYSRDKENDFISINLMKNAIDRSLAKEYNKDDLSWLTVVWQGLEAVKESERIEDIKWLIGTLEIQLRQLESKYVHLLPPVRAMIGYLFQKLGNDDEALAHYAASRLVEQRYVKFFGLF